MKNLLFLVIGLAVICGSIFLFIQDKVTPDVKEGKVLIEGTYVRVEIADTLETRVRGLSGKGVLRDGNGMLFVFDTPGEYGFWMKDMKFAIDIVWIDENKQVVDIDTNVLPETYPTTFYPIIPIKYVLEVPAGVVDRYLIATGTVVQF